MEGEAQDLEYLEGFRQQLAEGDSSAVDRIELMRENILRRKKDA